MKNIKPICVAAMLALAGWTECRGAVGPAPVPGDAPAMAPGAEAPVRVEGELLVKFRGGPGGAAARRVRAELGHKVLRDFEFIGWQHIKLPPGMSVDAALVRYPQDPDVLAAEPDCRFKVVDPLQETKPLTVPPRPGKDDLDPVFPNDPMFPQQWALTNICAPLAWAVTNGSTNVVVAVIDSGIIYNHEDLAGNMWRNPGEIPGNGIDDDGNGWTDDVFGVSVAQGSVSSNPMDTGPVFHGTACASIIGGVGNNGIGIAGVSCKSQLMAVRYLDGIGYCYLSDQNYAQDYVLQMKRHGVNVRAVSMSYGVVDWFSQSVKDGIDALGAEGVVVVACAQNYSNDNDVRGYYPASYTSANLIAVAASTPSDRFAGFSNWGRTSVDLAAPGSADIYTAYGPGTSDYRTNFNGTSAATPFVAGAVALLAATYPNATVAQLKAAILDTVDVIEPFAALVLTSGRLNVARALLHLRTNQAPVVVTAPQGRGVPAGSPVTLSVSAGGTPPLTYQWCQGAVPIPNATNALLRLPSVLSTQTGFWVAVSNAFGGVATEPVVVRVDPAVPQIVAWGYNYYGQCDVPLELTDVVALAAGRYHSLALQADGSVRAWGKNYVGEADVPPGLSGVKAIAAGVEFSMALSSNGVVSVWGDRWNWRSVTNVPAGLNDVAAIAAGQFHCVVLRSNGTVVAWGWNKYGQCNIPAGMAAVGAVAAGYSHSLALLTNGTVVAWGDNTYGQCNVPTGLGEVTSLVAGWQANLAVKRDQTVVAWGSDTYGQLQVPAGLSNVVAGSGYNHFACLKSDGTVVAWLPRATNSFWPANIPPGLRNVASIASNGGHELALLAQSPPPTITIRSQDTDTVLAWPEATAGWQLLSASSLAPVANWQPWPGPLFTNQGSVFTPVSPSNASHFFRLRSP